MRGSIDLRKGGSRKVSSRNSGILAVLRKMNICSVARLPSCGFFDSSNLFAVALDTHLSHRAR